MCRLPRGDGSRTATRPRTSAQPAFVLSMFVTAMTTELRVSRLFTVASRETQYPCHLRRSTRLAGEGLTANLHLRLTHSRSPCVVNVGMLTPLTRQCPS